MGRLTTKEPPWWRAALLAALFYLAAGLLFGELASRTSSGAVAYRRAAWLISAAAFFAHVRFERFRLASPPSRAAAHVTWGAAAGASLLAAAALSRAIATGTGRPVLLALSLILWPLIVALPAFLVALALGHLMRRR